jgi:hypothetical protein
MSNGSSPLLGFILLALAVLVYFIPTIVAGKRGHPNGTPIFLLNLFLGWTALGWLAALIWSASAISDHASPATSPLQTPDTATDDEPYLKLEKLADLKERGHLTAEEFEVEKAKILKT